jgi:hypothetical protein
MTPSSGAYGIFKTTPGAIRLDGQFAIRKEIAAGGKAALPSGSRRVVAVGAHKSLAALQGLLIDLIGNVTITRKLSAIRLDAQISRLPALLADPGIASVEPAKDERMSAGELELHLVEHGDRFFHCDTPSLLP